MKKRFIYHLKSFGHAFAGIKTLLLSERNMLIHALATLAVLAAGIWKELDAMRWCLILFAIALVWICEAFNTALEKLCNIVSKEYHPVIKQIKDISAAAVLIAAVIAAAIGIIVFLF